MIVAIAIIIALHLLLFFLLRTKILITPDYVGSDAFHVNYALKHYLTTSLKTGHIPFWTDLVQGGYPLFAEGQMGALFLPNIIAVFLSGGTGTYFFLLTISLFLLVLGMFLIFRQENVSFIPSLLLALNFAWIGPITFGWVHLTIIQAFSLVPFLFFFYHQWIQTSKKKYGFYLSLTLSQMLFAGNIQIVFISVLGLLAYSLLNEKNRRVVAWLLVWLGLGVIFALPQLVPSFQLHSLSFRSGLSGYSFATSVPFKLKNLTGLILPYFMGNPRNSSYPLEWTKEGIFWENTPFIGPLFVIVFIFSFLYAIWRRAKDKKYINYLLLAALFTLLALGDSSPLYFLFSVFPFTLFRVTSRFLFIAIFFLFLSLASLLKATARVRLVSFILLLCLFFNLVTLIKTAFDYNLLVDERALTNSLISFADKIEKKSATYVVGFDDAWAFQFEKMGWSGKKGIAAFSYLCTFPYSNANLISGIPLLNAGNVGLTLRRPDVVSGYIGALLEDVNASKETKENALSLFGVNTVIAFSPIRFDGHAPIPSHSNEKMRAVVYQLDTPSSSLYIPESLQRVEYVSDINLFLGKNGISKQKGMVENHPSVQQNADNVVIRELKDTDQSIEAVVVANKNGFVVFRKNWYPEWRAFVDGKEVSLYKTNITHLGIDVPSGRHTVSLIYIPTSFYVGTTISVTVLLLCLFIFFGKLTIKKNED